MSIGLLREQFLFYIITNSTNNYVSTADNCIEVSLSNCTNRVLIIVDIYNFVKHLSQICTRTLKYISKIYCVISFFYLLFIDHTQ